MGMSASQARFLGLTARKSNVEYEGQQVNQQRTALSNQSASLYNQMLAMKVPTPPDVTKYYNDQYVFEDGDTDFEIISGLGSSSSCVVRESKNIYDLRSQPVNSGLAVTIMMRDNLLTLNNSALNKLSENSNREQIRSILDNGGATDNELPFLCKLPSGDGFTSVADQSTIDNENKTKYINQLNETSLNDAKLLQFQNNIKNGIPTYFATTDASNITTYTRITEENYDEYIAEAEANPEAKIYQEKRDGINQPVKTQVSQAFCNTTQGLNFYTANNAHVETVYEEATAADAAAEKYIATTKTTKDELTAVPDYATQLANGGIVCFAAVQISTDETVYARIMNQTELDAFGTNPDLYVISAKSDSSSMIPAGAAEINDIDNLQFYVKKEKEVPEPPTTTENVELTQAMWNTAKAANNKELMDYYIANLDFSSDSAKDRNTLYYYTHDGGVRYVQQDYLNNFPDDMDYYQIKIPNEFYESEFKQYTNKTYTKCAWDTDNATGRYLQLYATTDTGAQRTFKLQFSRIKDDEAYDQAMMDYEYRKAEYEKMVADINAKTAEIQAQDKNLELRLKQLDTEQDALTNEMEAVKKVIEKNVEDTFKTFA